MNKLPRIATLAAASWAVAGTPGLRAQDTPTSRLAIAGVSVIDVEAGTVLANRTVLIEGGRIRSVTSGGQIPSGVPVIDGTG